MKDRNVIWKLIARKLSGEATPQELQELETLLRDDEDGQYSLHLLEALWSPEEAGDVTSAEEATDRLFLRLDSIPEEKTPAPAWSAARHQVRRRRWLPGKSLLRTQFKTTYRNLLRSKTFSLINILGLALGMASATLLLIAIYNEVTYDRFHANGDRIYEVMNKSVIDGKIQCWGSTPMALTPVLRTDYPEVEKVARTQWVGSFLFNEGDNHLRSWGYLTDPDFLSIFSLPLQEGDAATALTQPHSIVLTPVLAKKLFGDVDPVGKNHQPGQQ